MASGSHGCHGTARVLLGWQEWARKIKGIFFFQFLQLPEKPFLLLEPEIELLWELLLLALRACLGFQPPLGRKKEKKRKLTFISRKLKILISISRPGVTTFFSAFSTDSFWASQFHSRRKSGWDVFPFLRTRIC